MVSPLLSSVNTKQARFWKGVLDHAAFRFVQFAVETYGYIGKEAVRSVNSLGDIAEAELQDCVRSQGCICALGNAEREC